MDHKKYIYFGKTLFFPKDKILVIGDLHLGYEESLKKKGLEVPIKQFEETTSELKKIIEAIKIKYGKIEQMIFLGDIKHNFGFNSNERIEMNNLLSFLKKYISENKIIFIRGNHEKNDKNQKFIDYYLYKDIAFIHGHQEFKEIYDKNINLIVIGHLHPMLTIRDKMKIKQEKYKCFLEGRYKKKEFVVLPSFISITEGISINEYNDEKGYDFSIIPQKELMNFNAYVIQEINQGEGALNFGKIKNIE